MVNVPRLGTAPATATDATIARPGDQAPVVRAQFPSEGIDRGDRPRSDRGPTRSGPAPDAPGTQPGAATRIGAGIASYAVGQIITVGALAAIGAVGWPVLLAGVLGGVVAAKATDNYLTTGRTGLLGS